MQLRLRRPKRPAKYFLRHQLDTEGARTKGLSATNWALVFLILASLVLYTAGTEEEMHSGTTGIFGVLDTFILVIFGVEFVLRLLVSGPADHKPSWKDTVSYVRHHRLMVVVDFLAFAPELLFILMGWGSPGWLRSLRVFRLFKMARYFPAFTLVVNALKSCIQELLVAVSLSAILWYLASVALYLAEGAEQPDKFGSITRAMWWSVVTLTTVGYGDVYPVTVMGRIAAGVFALVGVGTVALPSGIIAAAFIQEFRERKAARREGR